MHRLGRQTDLCVARCLRLLWSTALERTRAGVGERHGRSPLPSSSADCAESEGRLWHGASPRSRRAPRHHRATAHATAGMPLACMHPHWHCHPTNSSPLFNDVCVLCYKEFFTFFLSSSPRHPTANSSPRLQIAAESMTHLPTYQYVGVRAVLEGRIGE